MPKKILPKLPQITEKPLLGGQLKLLQPQKGYRSAIEPILLASACVVKKGYKILDVGCGVGTASLVLARRFEKKDISITGIDCQEDLIEIAKENCDINKLQKSVTFFQADLGQLKPEDLTRGCFHSVITNPPFYKDNDSNPSPYKSKHIGHIESTVSLERWIYHCKKFLRSQGSLIIIYNVTRLSELIEALVMHKLGAIEIIPLWPRKGIRAKRVMVKAYKCRKLSTVLHQGLILHDAQGYTKEMQEILMEGAALQLERSYPE